MSTVTSGVVLCVWCAGVSSSPLTSESHSVVMGRACDWWCAVWAVWAVSGVW
jgi:hypothetical protein